MFIRIRMLTLKASEWFDLNRLGLLASFILSIFMLFFPIDIWVIFALEVCLFLYMYFLYRNIYLNKSFALMINNENKWFVHFQENKIEVVVKDYWLLKGQIFIWLKGSKKSISLVLSRSIIGANKFSQIRAKIK